MVEALLVCVCVDIARRHGDPGFGGTRPCRLWRHGTVLSRVTRKGLCVHAHVCILRRHWYVASAGTVLKQVKSRVRRS